jgi:2-oxo-4-hydroxy-4-carboxy-5-ureidoimidazoline decarboxylase
MTLRELNTCDQHAFVDALGSIFEGSPWVAERAWPRRPFEDVDQLHAVMVGVVSEASRGEQLALLLAHPELGTRARMSDASFSEQAGAGLDRLAVDDFDRVQRLTAAYRKRFGFPFLLAVKGRTKDDVLEALEQRMPHDLDVEWAEALRQVGRIAAFRLHDVIA